jgi:hypothetical protein
MAAPGKVGSQYEELATLLASCRSPLLLTPNSLAFGIAQFASANSIIAIR